MRTNAPAANKRRNFSGANKVIPRENPAKVTQDEADLVKVVIVKDSIVPVRARDLVVAAKVDAALGGVADFDRLIRSWKRLTGIKTAH
jgi:hypothetical protein